MEPFWGICVHCWAVALLWTAVGTQQCTQIGQNGPSVSFWGICVHCCDVVVRRGDATVYTNGRIGPLGAVSGHLCTLLRRESRYESRRELRQVARAPQPPRRAGGAPSRLVGKTGSERVAPLLGWHLRRGVNPHEPLKSQIIWESPDSPTTVPKDDDGDPIWKRCREDE